MDDRTQPDRENARPNRSAPSAPRTEDKSRNGRTSSGETNANANRRSSSSKPALTDRERNERWPVD
jgi:hypothetical protein